MGQTQTYEYDLFGNVLQSVDRNGDTISYTYTPLGYLTSVSSSKDNTSVSYTYDNFGNRTSMSDDTGATSYEYNIFNQLVNETKGSLVKDYTYDLNGNQLSFKITDNGSVTLNESYAYDKTNQVSSITAADVTANFTYDNNGNMLTYKRNSITTAYTYNTANMPVSVKTNQGSSYENDTITYYLNGNKKTTKDINNNTTTYVYDGMGRLSSEQETNGYSAVYSYDNYGNRIGKTVNDGDNSYNICYTYDKNNQLMTETKDVQGGQEINRYFYDANGNQTYRNEEKITLSTQKDYSVKLNSGGHGTSYEYDGLNRLVRADDGTNVSAYTYDGNNLRQSKTVNGVTTRHIYNGMNVVQEKEANSLKATYHRVGNQIIYSEVQGSKNFYIYNAQGNVSKLLNAAGETVADYTFDAFGVQKAVSGEVYNPFRHNGEYYDEELGYTYLRNRYYDNNIGRFITEDPIRDGLNWYSYCSGNPVMFVDSRGLSDIPSYLDWDGDGRIDTKEDRARFDANKDNVADWNQEMVYTAPKKWYRYKHSNKIKNFKHIDQVDEDCWAACISMCVQELTKSPLDISKIKKDERNDGSNGHSGPPGYARVINQHRYLVGSGYKVNENVYHFGNIYDERHNTDFNPLTFDDIVTQIDAGIPFIIASPEERNHVVVIIGYAYDEDTGEQMILYDDPSGPVLRYRVLSNFEDVKRKMAVTFEKSK